MAADKAKIVPALDLRPYAPGDEVAILALFEASFGRPLPAAFWEWRYRENPAGGPWIELAWDGDILAAHYAVSAATLSIDGRDVRAAQSMTTMTHPDYRGRGLFPTLGERLYERFAHDGGAAVYGFPNVNSHRGFVRDLHWCDLYEIPTLRATVANARFPKEASAAITVVDMPDHRVDALWGRIHSAFPVWQRRDSRWLKWRFFDCPAQEYTVSFWQDRDEIRGWAVVKKFGTAGLDIVDLVAESDVVAADLARWTLMYAEQSEIRDVATWSPMNAPWRAAIEACGLQPDGPVTYLGARALTPAATSIVNPQNWGFSMADSDIY